MKLLKKADFSVETDLKERLQRKLFGEAAALPSGRRRLEDDEVEGLYAAGSADCISRTEKLTVHGMAESIKH